MTATPPESLAIRSLSFSVSYTLSVEASSCVWGGMCVLVCVCVCACVCMCAFVYAHAYEPHSLKMCLHGNTMLSGIRLNPEQTKTSPQHLSQPYALKIGEQFKHTVITCTTMPSHCAMLSHNPPLPPTSAPPPHYCPSSFPLLLSFSETARMHTSNSLLSHAHLSANTPTHIHFQLPS